MALQCLLTGTLLCDHWFSVITVKKNNVSIIRNQKSNMLTDSFDFSEANYALMDASKFWHLTNKT